MTECIYEIRSDEMDWKKSIKQLTPQINTVVNCSNENKIVILNTDISNKLLVATIKVYLAQFNIPLKLK